MSAAGAGPGPRVALRNLGCRLNRVELDRIAAELEDAGCELVSEREADVVVINSCAVTGEAETKCRKAIRHAARQPQGPSVVVCGCLVTLSPQEVEALGPRVRVVSDKRNVAEEVLSSSNGQNAFLCHSDQSETEQGEVGGSPGGEGEVRHVGNPSTPHAAHAPLGVTRGDDSTAGDVWHKAVTPTGRMRPGVKIQDGCDNRCTFCVVWKARGASRSVAQEDVLAEVRAACSRGAKEVVLSGINLGSYRSPVPAPLASGLSNPELKPTKDAQGCMRLPELLELILDETDVARLRLSSIEPPDVDERLVRVMAESGGRIAPFLHMCLQSGCDRTLRRMARVYDTTLYRERAELARAYIPQLALGCDLIVGFPGEAEEDFGQSMAFCEEMAFAHMHVFRYSARPGTPAATMEGQVPPQVKAARSDAMHALADRMAHDYVASLVGTAQQVLVQEPGHGIAGGLVDVLVDDTAGVGELLCMTPHGMADSMQLDARS